MGLTKAMTANETKLNKPHWLIKFLIGIAAGLAIGLGLAIIGVIIAIYLGTAFPEELEGIKFMRNNRLSF